ncbi:MAG: hypothetical protein NTW69_07990 [Chloroflexi bacterium]|jgi:hypothetical protein|nr:hypothetical protein [Chloroflexota bacterium]
MVTELVVIPKGTHNILRRLTGQSRPDVALSLAIKELIHFRIESTKARIAAYEQKYGMGFPKFEEAWKNEKVKDSYSYPVEQDYMQWETALADLKLLEEILEWQA